MRTLLVLACLLTLPCLAQNNRGSGQKLRNKTSHLNLDLEQQISSGSMPLGWSAFGDGYDIGPDTVTRHGGKLSIRIQKLHTPLQHQTGSCDLSFPAIFQGKQVEISGFIKTDNIRKGFAGFFIHVEGEGGTLAHKTIKKELRGSRDWTAYSITLALPEKANRINFGAFLNGSGTIWIDDFELSIDGKALEDAITKDIKLCKADEDVEFEFGSALEIESLSSLQVEDLAMLGQVWGFLKYYHPAVARGEYNWDYELFRMLPKVLSAKHPEERNMLMLQWVKSLGPIEKDHQKTLKLKNVQLKPGLEWISDDQLGATLCKQLKEVMHARRTEEHYYIDLYKPQGNPFFKHEKNYNLISFPDDGLMILCLFRYWNAMQYYNPNRETFASTWPAVLREFIPRFAACKTKLAYSLLTQELLCKANDTYPRFDWNRVVNQHFGEYYGAARLDMIEGNVVVTGFYDEAYGLKTGLLRGDIIEMINGKPLPEIISERLPFTKAPSLPGRVAYIAKNLMRGTADSIQVQYNRNGTSYSCKIKCYPKGSFNMQKNTLQPDTCFKLITPTTGYLFMGKFQHAYTEKLLPDILQTKTLIVDLRSEGSEQFLYLLSYFIPGTTEMLALTTGSITQPGLFLKTSMRTGRKSRDVYDGKLILLVNGQTRGEMERLALAFRSVPGAVIIGSLSSGFTGHESYLPLPGGVGTWISGVGLYDANGQAVTTTGIRPDIEVNQSIEGIRSGKDDVLEAALAYAGKRWPD